MATPERHSANIGILDSIIGIAGGIRRENRRLSLSIEQAIGEKGEKQKEKEKDREEVVLTDEEEEDWSNYTNSTDLKKGIKRKATTRAQRPNPFDFRKNKSNPNPNMDRKLDEILAKLQTVSTKDDLKRVNRSCLLYTSPSPRD